MDRILTPELRELYELTSPEGLRAVRILPGRNGKIVIIGRGQKYVDAYADFLRFRGYAVETFSGDLVVDGFGGKTVEELWDSFYDLSQSKRKVHGVDYLMTEWEVKGTGFYKADQAWIQKAIRKGYAVLDIGDPVSAGYSIFLDMEYLEVFK